MEKERKKGERKNLDDLLEIFSLIVALTSVIIFVFFLFFSYNKCIIFTEPVFFVRASEVVMGIIAIAVIISMLRRIVIKVYHKNEK